jgi:hypothetical protein
VAILCDRLETGKVANLEKRREGAAHRNIKIHLFLLCFINVIRLHCIASYADTLRGVAPLWSPRRFAKYARVANGRSVSEEGEMKWFPVVC